MKDRGQVWSGGGSVEEKLPVSGNTMGEIVRRALGCEKSHSSIPPLNILYILWPEFIVVPHHVNSSAE